MYSLQLSDLIDETEEAQLMAQYGPTLRRNVSLAMPFERFSWWADQLTNHPDRRGEVVMVIRRGERVVLHSKAHYPNGTFRLPTGGVAPAESVLDALRRELKEETGLVGTIERCLGIISYEFRYECQSVPFVSYVFLINAPEGELAPLDPRERIAAFRWATMPEIADAIAKLHTLPSDWSSWGRFRAVAHELVQTTLF